MEIREADEMPQSIATALAATTMLAGARVSGLTGVAAF